MDLLTQAKAFAKIAARSYYDWKPEMPISELVKRWAEDHDKFYNDEGDPLYYIPTNIAVRIRGTDRVKHQARSDEEMEALKQSLDTHGFSPHRPATIYIFRDGKLLMDEGNHRLRAAQELGIPEIPVRIYPLEGPSDGGVDPKYISGERGVPGGTLGVREAGPAPDLVDCDG